MNKYGVVAIHGGNIEPGTEEVAKSIAGGNLALFVNEKGPHVSSVDFESEELEEFLKDIDVVISIHGEKTMNDSFVMLGGLDKDLAETIERGLKAAGFKTKTPPDNLAGDNSKNICNRGKSGKGVQLELSRSLREELIGEESMMENFSLAIKDSLL